MVANLKMIERRKTREMNAVGIDVSKGKSTVVVMRPFGEVVAEPFEVSHTDAELSELACFLGELPGETRIVMEYTGNYWQPIAKVLYDAGLFVCVVNALLIYKYGNNSIRKGKTDKLDAVKIANYCLDRWANLERYTPADQIRQILKTCRRQYESVYKAESQSQKQSDLSAGRDVSRRQHTFQKCFQGYGWTREMGGFRRKLLAPRVCLHEI